MRRRTKVALHPVADALLIGAGALIAGAVAIVARTGAIRPTRPGDPDDLSFLDRPQTRGTLHGADRLAHGSDLVWYGALASGAVLPIVTGLEHGKDEGWVDLGLYAETVALTAAITQTVRITTRRPRPSAYVESRLGTYDPATAPTSSSMSFFSGHIAAVAAVGATMTTLALLRRPGTARPWLSLGLATAASATISYLRVASRRHFVTDMLAANLAGALIGALVPHLHRGR